LRLRRPGGDRPAAPRRIGARYRHERAGRRRVPQNRRRTTDRAWARLGARRSRHPQARSDVEAVAAAAGPRRI